MERRIYNWFVALLLVAGGAVVLHMLMIWGSIPPVLPTGSRSSMSRQHYVMGIIVSALFLPAICALFSWVAHRGQEIDVISWFFVAAFYMGFLWLWTDLNRLAVAAAAGTSYSARVPHIFDPLGLLIIGGSIGPSFWMLKQEGRLPTRGHS